MPLGLTSNQLATVMAVAGGLPVEKRTILLQRIAARLRLLDRFDDGDVDTALRLALIGLVQSAA